MPLPCVQHTLPAISQAATQGVSNPRLAQTSRHEAVHAPFPRELVSKICREPAGKGHVRVMQKPREQEGFFCFVFMFT